MTIPKIDGFTSRRRSLADEWLEPTQFEHPALAPAVAMATIEPYPTDWLIIEQYVRRDHDSDGVSTATISSGARDEAFSDHSWSTSSLGNFGIVDDTEVELGLSESVGEGFAEFFCQVQLNHGLRPPTVEMSQPFLWFWDAIRDGNDWFYVDSAGVEYPLVRSTIEGDNYTVEVRALEFRRYLAQRGMLGLIQHDHVLWAAAPKFELRQHDYESDWCTFTWHAAHGQPIPQHPALSRLLGKNIITGIPGRPVPAWLDYGDHDYEDFIIGVNDETGALISFTCDPDKVSNYFGKNPDAPNYLTPVHFDPKVLDRYLDDPDRYSVSSTRLSALDMWSISIGRTSTGDVDVYLGDLGRDMPWQEQAHWRAHNIPPRGRMNDDRFRRDFLGQFAGEQDPLDALREAYRAVNEAAKSRFGWPIFRPLGSNDAVAFAKLHPPVLTTERALVQPVLVLAKALVDAIDSKTIKSLLESSEQQSLRLLELLLIDVGGDASAVQPIRHLYRLRSSGGVAHLAGESRAKIHAAVGIAGLSPADALNKLANDLAGSLTQIAEQLRKSDS
ncbi:hypothetical protein PX701_18205 [Agromyces sp. H3Y2-19a]|uniref:hypothetical protein n=1 Tax=Agromyces chromiiresistens TaxID=3030835 RepID=UPI0023BA3373|nr:hypothetical protein [Agromyces chromiiresistens]MDF0515564.1 hypothetical protein [Agromyces chromiiresistens]